jgi:hypothetical protein
LAGRADAAWRSRHSAEQKWVIWPHFSALNEISGDM